MLDLPKDTIAYRTNAKVSCLVMFHIQVESSSPPKGEVPFASYARVKLSVGLSVVHVFGTAPKGGIH